MTQSEQVALLEDILAHEQCITLLNTVIDTAMHNKSLHQQKLDQLRPKDPVLACTLLTLLNQYNQSNQASQWRLQQIESWLKSTDLPLNHISPINLADSEQIHQWVQALCIPDNVVNLSRVKASSTIPKQPERSFSQTVAYKALLDFFGSERVLYVFLQLYQQHNHVEIPRAEAYA